MIDYTPAELCMRRLIVIRNLLDDLNYIGFEKALAPSVAVRYGILELTQFIDSYNGLLGKLDPYQKSLVLSVAELVADVTRHKDALKKMRNNWIAHLQDKGMFAEDASAFIIKNNLPSDHGYYHEMFARIIIFVDTVQALLPEIAGPTVSKFNRTLDARPIMRAVDLEQAGRIVFAKLERVRKTAESKHPQIPWDMVLGAAGVRLEKLGVDDACTYPMFGPNWKEGGAGVQ